MTTNPETFPKTKVEITMTGRAATCIIVGWILFLGYVTLVAYPEYVHQPSVLTRLIPGR